MLLSYVFHILNKVCVQCDISDEIGWSFSWSSIYIW